MLKRSSFLWAIEIGEFSYNFDMVISLMICRLRDILLKFPVIILLDG